MAQHLAALAAADPAGALRWARRRIELEPLSEQAHRELMHLLAARDDRPAALAAYEALAARLRRELGLAPSAETRALAEQLRRGAGAPAQRRREQAIRFTSVDGRRVAYATVGSGPPLVLPAMWISHLEEEWEFPEVRAFIEALAAEHTVVRYDRLGTGLSDREPRPGMAAELATLAAVMQAAGADAEPALLGISRGAPDRGRPRRGRPRRAPPRARWAPTGTARPSPRPRCGRRSPRPSAPTGERAPASSPTSGCPAPTGSSASASPPTSAPPPRPRPRPTSWPRSTRCDVRPLLASVHVPVLVVHRRDDRAMPFAGARELAAALPDAELVALAGDVHPPWLGDPAPVLDALLPFLRG